MKSYAPLRLTAATALGVNSFCVAFTEAEYDDMFSLILVYEGEFEQPWTRYDVPRIIDSVTAKAGEDGKPLIYAKSDEGDVYSLSPGGATQHVKIAGAGVYSEDEVGLGYTNKIVEIDGTLFVTGYRSQLYCLEDDEWRWFDREKLPEAPEGFDYAIFRDMKGVSESDAYMSVSFSPSNSSRKLTLEEEERAAAFFEAGKVDEALAIHHAAEGETRVLEGRLFHWNGSEWKVVAKPRSGAHYDQPATISDIFVENADRIWAVGDNGVILLGNARHGFQDVSFKGDDENLRSITKFGDRIVIASDYALHWFDGHLLAPLKPVLDPSINKNVPTPLKVQSVGDLLYYFDYKHGISTFDGEEWTQIDIPEELLEREFKGQPPKAR